MARQADPPYIAVVGGVNVDIGGRSAAPLKAGDSNPGRVRMSLGGVGRNIAHDLALLGVDVRLVAALGTDDSGQRVAASCGELGIDLSHALWVEGAATSAYLYIADERGDMALALSDMEICARLDPAYLSTLTGFLNGARLVVADANLPAESLAWLAEHVEAPIFADPVSTVKAEKLRPILGGLHTLKPNRLEAELLSGVAIVDEESLAQAARALLSTGLERVFISLGSGGAYAADAASAVRLPALPARPCSSTGAGDAFMAALAWAWLHQRPLAESARLAQAAAALTIESEETVCPHMSAKAVLARAGL